MTIEEILSEESISKKIELLKQKDLPVPEWDDGLELEYNPKKHTVITDKSYQDLVSDDGMVEHVSRVVYGLQKLSVNRMLGFSFGVPVIRNYRPQNANEEKVAEYLEAIYERVRVDMENMERGRSYYAACEMLTIWYAKEDPNELYGFKSPIKLRCKSYSPMNGEQLYPLFDDDDDLIALSVGYKRKKLGKEIEYFDTYSKDLHIRWKKENNDWEEDIREPITLGKIPAIYEWRKEPIWEDNTTNVEEIEWTYSRTGNYVRKNSRPLLVISSEGNISYGNESDERQTYKDIMQLNKGEKIDYVTWQQSVDTVKNYTDGLEKIIFTSIQLPDISFDNMNSGNISGESRKQMLVDMFIKVGLESGKLLRFLDREMNVVKSFLKAMQPSLSSAIDTLQVEQLITPFTISDEKERMSIIATGKGSGFLSTETAIREAGLVKDVAEELKKIREDEGIDTIDNGE